MTDSEVRGVLLVDDVVEIRYLLRMLLANVRACQIVGEAEDGRRAIELAALLQPDVIVLDMEMPIVDGRAALPRIIEAVPDARVIVYSSAPPELEPELLAMGAFRYVQKGRDPTLVATAVRDALLVENGAPQPIQPVRATQGLAEPS